MRGADVADAPTVSVILPTYNRARWLSEAIRSLLGQTRPPLEIIVVDDGSTDDTPAICSRFARQVRYLRQDNAGVGAARNRGIREAQGEWIAFADSDDVWDAAKLDVQLDAVAAVPEAGWSITGCEVMDLQGRPLEGRQSFSRAFPLFRELHLSPEVLFARYLKRGEVSAPAGRHTVYFGDAYGLLFLGNVVLPTSAIVRRSVFDQVGLFDETFRVAGDTEFFHRLAARSPVAIVMTSLIRYRQGELGALSSSSNTAELIENGLESLRRAAKLRPELTPREARAFRDGKQRLLLRLAYSHLSDLRRPSARSKLVEAWREGAPLSARLLGMYLATLLPRSALRGLHRLKRWVSA